MASVVSIFPSYHRTSYLARRLRASESTLHLDRCPSCGSNQLRAVSTIETADGEPVIERSRCDECTLVSFNRRPTAEWYRDFYASAWDPTGVVPPDSDYEPVAAVLEPFLPDKDAHLLEIGCGYGAALETFRRRGFRHLYGSEASQKRADHARSRGFQVAMCSAEELHTDPTIAAGAPYHAIYSWHVFEHLYDPAVAVDNLAKLLVPGGVVYVCVPHVEAEHTYFIGHYLPHIHSYSEQSLSTLFERRGFRIEYLDDSLRIVARKADATGPSVDHASRPFAQKLVRDFGLRALGPSFDGEAALRYSQYRGSREILEPSYGDITPLEGRSPAQRALSQIRQRVVGLYLDEPRKPWVDLALRTVARKQNEVMGRVQVQATAGDDHLRVIYPGDDVIAYVK